MESPQVLDVVRKLSERRHARRVSRDLMSWYDRVRSEQPDLSGSCLYRRVLMRRSGLDGPAADDVLRRATQIFEWYSDRDLKFRDVALVVVFDESVQGHTDSIGVQTNLGRIVAQCIPESL